MISTTACSCDIATPSDLASWANCRLRNSGQCAVMIFSMSGFSMPRARIWSMRQSGRSKAQIPGGSKERTSAIASSTSSSFGYPARISSRETRRYPSSSMLPTRNVAISRTGVDASDIESCQVRYSWQPLGAGQRVLERELLGLLVLPRVVGGVDVVLEVGVEVDLVEGIALLLRRGGSLPPACGRGLGLLASSLPRGARRPRPRASPPAPLRGAGSRPSPG